MQQPGKHLVTRERAESLERPSSCVSWGLIGGSSPGATGEGARRWAISASTTKCTLPPGSFCGPSSAVRPSGFDSVFGFGSFFSIFSLQRARTREGCGKGEVNGGVPWTSQQDTPQGADVDGSKEVNCPCPLSLV